MSVSPAAVAQPVAQGEPLVVFVHVRKTAGFTMRQIILRQYGGRKRVRLVSDYFEHPERSEDVREIAANPPEGLRVVHGHMLFRKDIEWPPGTRFFTIVRDPVERVLSHYFWYGEQRAKRGESMPTLEEALSGRPILDNLHTRVLSGSDPPHGKVTREMLDGALEALDRMTVVALTDRFDESLLLLTRAFGWRRSLYERSNVTQDRRPRDEMPPEALALIEEHNALDAELYIAARERFERDIAAQPAEFGLELASLRRANAQWAALEEPRRPPPLPPRMSGASGGVLTDLQELVVQSQADLLVRQRYLEELEQKPRGQKGRPAEPARGPSKAERQAARAKGARPKAERPKPARADRETLRSERKAAKTGKAGPAKPGRATPGSEGEAVKAPRKRRPPDEPEAITPAS